MMTSKKPRRWLHPNGASRDYQRILTRYVNGMLSHIRGQVFPMLSVWSKETPRTDSVSEDLRTIIAYISQLMVGQEWPVIDQLDNLFSITASFNDRQFKAVVKQAVGVDIFQVEPWLRPMSEQWAAENVRLIKSIPAKHLDDVEGIVLRGVQEGRSATYIQRQLQQRFKIPKNRAKLIASDQVSKANSMITVQRLKQIGVKRYRWRGMKDPRERPEHLAREGQVFRLDKPPADGHPGYPIRCRCWMEAIFDD